jgi:hypothetical protein
VELEKTAKLIQYYLTLLASEKAQCAADYQPTDWELLTPEEQRARALKRVELREEERIANLLLWNSVKKRLQGISPTTPSRTQSQKISQE